MNITKNQQYRNTDDAIQSYLLKIIKKKKLNSITVSEICKYVGINRSSFYLHYQDVYDLMDKICLKYLGQIHEELAKYIEENEDYMFALVLIARHIKNNMDFYNAYFNYIEPVKIENAFKELIFGFFLPEVKALGDFSDHQIEYHFLFVMNGMLALLRCWLANGCRESPDEIVELIIKSMSASSDYLNTKPNCS